MEVKRLLQEAAGPEEAEELLEGQDGQGMTPLLWAAREGHVALARWLLDRGARVNHMDSSGRTALFEACSQGRAKLAMLLLERGANPRLKEWEGGLSPLMAACDEDGHADIVRAILRRCPEEANERDWGGRSPVWWACFWGSPKDVLRAMLHGPARADYSMPDHCGRTPLDVATHNYQDCRALIQVRPQEGRREEGQETPAASCLLTGPPLSLSL